MLYSGVGVNFSNEHTQILFIPRDIWKSLNIHYTFHSLSLFVAAGSSPRISAQKFSGITGFYVLFNVYPTPAGGRNSFSPPVEHNSVLCVCLVHNEVVFLHQTLHPTYKCRIWYAQVCAICFVPIEVFHVTMLNMFA